MAVFPSRAAIAYLSRVVGRAAGQRVGADYWPSRRGARGVTPITGVESAANHLHGTREALVACRARGPTARRAARSRVHQGIGLQPLRGRRGRGRRRPCECPRRAAEAAVGVLPRTKNADLGTLPPSSTTSPSSRVHHGASRLCSVRALLGPSNGRMLKTAGLWWVWFLVQTWRDWLANCGFSLLGLDYRAMNATYRIIL